MTDAQVIDAIAEAICDNAVRRRKPPHQHATHPDLWKNLAEPQRKKWRDDAEVAFRMIARLYELTPKPPV